VECHEKVWNLAVQSEHFPRRETMPSVLSHLLQVVMPAVMLAMVHPREKVQEWFQELGGTLGSTEGSHPTAFALELFAELYYPELELKLEENANLS
jgi:hypothetical protein